MARSNGLVATVVTLVVAALLLVAAPHGAHAQGAQGNGVSSLDPMPPKAGETLYVKYLPSAPNATLTAASERFAVVEIETLSGVTLAWSRMSVGSDGVTEAASFPLPADAIGGTVRFYAEERFAQGDPAATQRFVVVREGDHGIRPDQTDEEIDRRQKEFRLSNPDDLSGWRTKWFILASRNATDALQSVIRADLAEIEAASLATPDAECLRIEGLWTIGDRDAAMAALEKLAIVSPESPATDRALVATRDAAQGAWAAQWISALRRVAERSNAAHALRMGGLVALASDSATPLDLVDRCADALLAARPGDARPLVAQVRARQVRGEGLDRCDGLASRATELILAKDFRPSADPDGGLRDTLLRDLLLVRATLAETRGDTPAALLFAAAARGISPNDPGDAPAALDRGWALVTGKPTEPQAATTSSEPVVAAAEPTPVAAPPSEPTPATPAPVTSPTASEMPDFTLKDIDGNEVRLTDFRGKVVVLNFWFVACKPCRLEMPNLNDLVAKFDGRDVVFLAPCLDDREKASAFLADNTFKYRTLVDGSSASSAMRVRAYPTHAVIDRSGKVVLYRTGGNESVLRDVTAAVESALER
jgi:peroxiredoxin